MISSELKVTSYSTARLHKLLGMVDDQDGARYLDDYLRRLGARGVVLEQHYVDRHYLADFSAYHALSFNASRPSCRRVHFFNTSARAVDRIIAAAFVDESSRVAAGRELDLGYLGFVVIRPLPGAPVGRTVLRPYPPDGVRRDEVVRPYEVHLAGIELHVEGLAYQQQDGGAAVCASTALWCALQRVAHVAGHRTPSPSAITAAARSPFPASHGMGDDEMARALSEMGYIADQFPPASPAHFRAKLIAYLESRLPVVLTLGPIEGDGPAHAVTVTGFRDERRLRPVPLSVAGRPQPRMRSAGVDVIYVHDDNLGPYAEYELVDMRARGEALAHVRLRRGRSHRRGPSWWRVDDWEITNALVPKPEDMRLPVETLLLVVAGFREVFASVFKGIALHFRARFASGVAYQRELFTQGFVASELAAFLQRTSLPRHVGVVSTRQDDDTLCELLLDASDTSPHFIAIVAPGVPALSAAWIGLMHVAKALDCQLLTAPPQRRGR